MEPTLQELVCRFQKHIAIVENRATALRPKVFSLYAAKGYHKLIAEKAIAEDDDAACNVVLGAPHWVTFNAGTLEAMLDEAHNG